MASLDSVKQKIVRAAEHLKSLETELQRYLDGKPGEMVAEEETDSGRVILHFHARTPIPPSVPLIIGDALQNLRSSLDYLVWELVLTAKNNPGDKHMFPICDSVEAFEYQLGRHRLDGIPADALTEIKGLQPYHYGQRKEGAPIRVIDSFCNINKHRRVLLTVLAAYASRTEIISSHTGRSIQTTTTPRYHGAEIAVGPAPNSARPEEKVEMKGNAILLITFDEGAAKGIDVGRSLNWLWHFVNEDVIPKFERFFT